MTNAQKKLVLRRTTLNKFISAPQIGATRRDYAMASLREKEAALFAPLPLSSVGTFEFPKELLCPISLEVMAEPCLNAAGNTYERDQAVQTFKRNREDPLTRTLLGTNTHTDYADVYTHNKELHDFSNRWRIHITDELLRLAKKHPTDRDICLQKADEINTDYKKSEIKGRVLEIMWPVICPILDVLTGVTFEITKGILCDGDFARAQEDGATNAESMWPKPDSTDWELIDHLWLIVEGYLKAETKSPSRTEAAAQSRAYALIDQIKTNGVAAYLGCEKFPYSETTINISQKIKGFKTGEIGKN
jgi:hypothetical protein